MGINCHISVEVPNGDNISIMNAADVRWSSYDDELRETFGIPNHGGEGFWEHLENHEYQLVLDAALTHKQVLLKERDQIHEGHFNPDINPAHTHMDAQVNEQHLNRTDEWISYYEIAATLVKLGHKVVCYGC